MRTFDYSTRLPEVAQSHVYIRVLPSEEHVFWLDVPVHVPALVHVVDGGDERSEDVGAFPLCVRMGGHTVEQVTPGAELQN